MILCADAIVDFAITVYQLSLDEKLPCHIANITHGPITLYLENVSEALYELEEFYSGISTNKALTEKFPNPVRGSDYESVRHHVVEVLRNFIQRCKQVYVPGFNAAVLMGELLEMWANTGCSFAACTTMLHVARGQETACTTYSALSNRANQYAANSKCKMILVSES